MATIWKLPKNPATAFDTNIIPAFSTGQNSTTTLDQFGEWSCSYSKVASSASQWLASNAFDKNSGSVVQTSGCGKIKEYIQLNCPKGVRINPERITLRGKHKCDYTVAPYFDMYLWVEGYDASTNTWTKITNEIFMPEDNAIRIFEFIPTINDFYSGFRFYLECRTSTFSYIDYGMIYDIEITNGTIKRG